MALNQTPRKSVGGLTNSSSNINNDLNESTSSNDVSPLESYYDDVIRMIDDQLKTVIEQLKADLNKTAQSQGLNGSKINEACDKLLQKARKEMEKNMTKFLLYSIKNVFSVNQDHNVNKLSLSVKEDEELLAINEELIQARRRNEILSSDYIKLSSEYRDMDTLLLKMRDALFELRLTSQNLEGFGGNQSLGQIAAEIHQRREVLEQYKRETQDYLRRLEDRETVVNNDVQSSSNNQSRADEEGAPNPPRALDINITKNSSALRGIASSFNRK